MTPYKKDLKEKWIENKGKEYLGQKQKKGGGAGYGYVYVLVCWIADTLPSAIFN